MRSRAGRVRPSPQESCLARQPGSCGALSSPTSSRWLSVCLSLQFFLSLFHPFFLPLTPLLSASSPFFGLPRPSQPPVRPRSLRSLGEAEAGAGTQARGPRGGVGPDTWCPRQAGGGSGKADKPRSSTRAPAQPALHLISSWHLPPLPLWKSHQRPPASGLPLDPSGTAAGPAPSPHWPALVGSTHTSGHTLALIGLSGP